MTQVFLTVAELVECKEATLQTGPFGTQLKASDYVEHGIPVINVRNIGFGSIREAELEYLGEGMAGKLHQHHLKKDDIVFGRKGAVERHVLINEKSEGWIQGSDCLRLRISSSRVNNKYLSYYFTTSSHKNWMEALCSFGATMSSLNQDIVKRISFPSPHIGEQKKIASILTAYDDLIDNNQRRIALLEKMAEELYREWFVRLRFPGYEQAQFEKGLPMGWHPVSFSEICKFEKGKNLNATYSQPVEAAIPYINVDTLENGASTYAIPAKNSVISASDDILMLMDGARSGIIFRGCLGIVGSTFALIRVEKRLKNIVYEYLRAGSESIVSNNTGSAIPHANKEFINRMVLFLPDSDDLIERFDSIYKNITQQSRVLELKNTVIKKTKMSLLNRLFSGKISVGSLDIRVPPSMQEAA